MNQTNKTQKYRVFSFSDRMCPSQPTGGPGGVNYRLLFANRNHGLIETMYHIFQDVVIEKDTMLNISFLSDNQEEADRLIRYYKKLDEYYRFTPADVYYFHDVLSAYVFTALYRHPNTVLVYHQQGSLYKEWEYFSGTQDLELKASLDDMFLKTLRSIQYLAFPSIGAKESLISSDPSLEKVVNEANIKVLYNGCDNPQNVSTSNETINRIIAFLKKCPDPKFITVAALNEAKGVERLAEFFADVKKTYDSFVWIVVGDGVKAEELQEKIDRYGLKENVLWLRNRIPHDDILAMFQYTDFYILAHRFSIFDFSTIEAMSYGNIPILTPVGGNKEIIIDNNGVFLNELSSCKDLNDFVEQELIVEGRQKNIRIAKELFGEKPFLQGYADLTEEIIRG